MLVLAVSSVANNVFLKYTECQNVPFYFWSLSKRRVSLLLLFFCCCFFVFFFFVWLFFFWFFFCLFFFFIFIYFLFFIYSYFFILCSLCCCCCCLFVFVCCLFVFCYGNNAIKYLEYMVKLISLFLYYLQNQKKYFRTTTWRWISQITGLAVEVAYYKRVQTVIVDRKALWLLTGEY